MKFLIKKIKYNKITFILLSLFFFIIILTMSIVFSYYTNNVSKIKNKYNHLDDNTLYISNVTDARPFVALENNDNKCYYNKSELYYDDNEYLYYEVSNDKFIEFGLPYINDTYITIDTVIDKNDTGIYIDNYTYELIGKNDNYEFNINGITYNIKGVFKANYPCIDELFYNVSIKEKPIIVLEIDKDTGYKYIACKNVTNYDEIPSNFKYYGYEIKQNYKLHINALYIIMIILIALPLFIFIYSIANIYIYISKNSIKEYEIKRIVGAKDKDILNELSLELFSNSSVSLLLTFIIHVVLIKIFEPQIFLFDLSMIIILFLLSRIISRKVVRIFRRKYGNHKITYNKKIR